FNENIQIRTCESLDALRKIRNDWERLLGIYPHSTIFSTWDWLAPWWHAFAAKDRVLALAGYSAGTLIGLAPLALNQQRGFGADLTFVRQMGDGTPDSDNLDIPVLPGYEAAFSQSIFGWLENHCQAWDVCQLRTLPSTSLVAHCIIENLKSRGWSRYFSTRPQSVIELPDSWEKYGKKLS